MAPPVMGNPDRPELGEELTNNFCRTDPEIAAHFAWALTQSEPRGFVASTQVASDAFMAEIEELPVQEREP